ncbi:MAG: hypothetical protein AB2417_18545 [Clostridiaceae bacterium]
MNLNELRWKSLGMVGLQYEYIRNYINNKYNISINEKNLNDFLNVFTEKYSIINESEVLFNLEDIAFKKVSVFYLREKEQEELLCPMLREQFKINNRLNNTINNKEIKRVDETLYPCYVNFYDRFTIIKMAQLRKCETSEVDRYNVVTNTNEIYYHYTKFVIDLKEGIVAMFYNDVQNEDDDSSSKGKAIIEKKQAFYNLFAEGDQNTLTKCSFDYYLNNYIKNYLQSVELNEENSKEVIAIETSDPIEPKNNLRSSKEDGRHNEYRLRAIKYALDNEEHTVKTMECNIGHRWFQLRNQGEIISSITHFDTEVIQNVCREIFPDYELSTEYAMP